MLRDTSTLGKADPEIEPATFRLPDNRSCLLSYCCPLEILEIIRDIPHDFNN